jgi:probable phosphoglycerate mutase
MDLYLIRSARTPWDDERRMQGNLDIPIGPEGAEEVREGLRDLVPLEFRAVYSSPTLCAYQTAQIVAREAGRAVRRIEALAEADLGLWQGLFESDVKRKHRKAYATWKATPLAVVPPHGEGFRAAYWRLSGAIGEILAANGRGRAVAVVAPRIAHRLIECRLRGVQPEEFWEEDGIGFRADRFSV